MAWPLPLVRWQPNGAVAIVTGASSGIGRELCKLLVARGSTVVATARRADRLEKLRAVCLDSVNNPTPSRSAKIDASSRSAEFPPSKRGQLITVVGDITEQGVRTAVVNAAAEIAGGRLDLLVNNAGVGALGPFANATPGRLRRVMEVNFFAPVELAREALPFLKQGRAPVLCNVSSVLGHRAVPDKSEYCASKFALHGWSDSIRAEWKPFGIQVTLVSPSTTESEFFDSVIDTPAGERSRSFGSWTPEKVARAALSAITARRSESILSLGGKALVYADRLTPPIINLILAKRDANRTTPVSAEHD